MQQNGNNRFLFLTDLLAIYSFFFIVFTYYKGNTSIPFEGNLLMGLIGFLWFIISINFNICKANRGSQIIDVIKNVFVAYSVLSAIVVALVATLLIFRKSAAMKKLDTTVKVFLFMGVFSYWSIFALTIFKWRF